MASSQFVLLLGIVLVTEITVASGCATQMADCVSKTTGITDASQICKVFPEVKRCLIGLRGTCGNSALDTALETSIKGMDSSLSSAGCSSSTGGGDGSSSSKSGGNTDCTEAGYEKCLEGASIEKPCPAFKCVNDMKDKCDGKDFPVWYKKNKKGYDMAKEKCGCGNLQPSILALLVTALLMAVRSYF